MRNTEPTEEQDKTNPQRTRGTCSENELTAVENGEIPVPFKGRSYFGIACLTIDLFSFVIQHKVSVCFIECVSC